MKLTKSERHTAYIIMLAEAENPTRVFYDEHWRSPIESGFCWMYKILTGSDELYFCFKNLLPELYKKRAYKESIIFFQNWDARKAALQKCIKETYDFEKEEEV